MKQINLPIYCWWLMFNSRLCFLSNIEKIQIRVKMMCIITWSLIIMTFFYTEYDWQEAFRERRHLHVCDLWPWVVTLTLRHRFLYCPLVPGMMSVSVIVCQIWQISSFFVTFDLRLWPSSSVKVTFFFIIDGCYVVAYWFQVRSL